MKQTECDCPQCGQKLDDRTERNAVCWRCGVLWRFTNVPKEPS